ncbi:MAG TPA: alpha/beta fold hydrolase [Allosphingosinicella sp.]|jgi:pimeloyl-ACP methyl ester carboxylesterase
MSTPNAAFVLVHGGWHSQSAWDKLTPLLEARGHLVLTLDLPGAGANTIPPKSLAARPFDPATFAAEPSPIAEVTLEERTAAVIAAVKDAAATSGGKVVLVGHSAGGMVVSAVAERIPEQLAAIVYIAGFMVAHGISLLEMLPHETMASALSVGLFVGDPVAIGATRINPGPADDAYRALLKASFYADVCDTDFERIVTGLHSDEPNGGALAPSDITPERFGSVPRHYIRTTQDRAVPLSGQDHMIATVDPTIGGSTITHTMETSHSPFLSQPDKLATILDDVAAQTSRT